MNSETTATGRRKRGSSVSSLQIRLIGAEAVDGQVRALDPHHRADLRRHALLPRQPFAEHHRLADEQDRRPLRIHRLVDAADTISRRIERVVDDAPADACCARCAPARRSSRAADRDGGAALRPARATPPARRCTWRSTSSPAPSARTAAMADVDDARRRGSDDQRPTRGRSQSASDTPTAAIITRTDDSMQHVPTARQEPGRQEMPVEPALIGDDAHEQTRRAADATRRRPRTMTRIANGLDATLSTHSGARTSATSAVASASSSRQGHD